MGSSNQVLIVVAHPDDAEIAMGMKILALTGAGHRVWIHCLSGGNEARRSEQETARLQHERQAEAVRAGEILGVQHYSFGSFREASFTEFRGEINRSLFDVIEACRPDIIYTHYPDDQHIDHVMTSDVATTVALREARDLIYFRSPYSLRFEPNLVFFGSPELFETKLRALRCFVSQAQIAMSHVSSLAAKLHHHHVHHGVLRRLDTPIEDLYSELFSVSRMVEKVAVSGNSELVRHSS